MMTLAHRLVSSNSVNSVNSVNSPNQNHLLAALPTAEFETLSAYLELQQLHLGQFLYGPGEQLQYAYFPTTSIISLHYGVSLFMGGDTTASSAVVQTAGYAYRLNSKLLMEQFSRAGFLQRLLLRYTQALMTQMSQAAVCNRHHSVEQQLCRWLLLTLDRLPSNELIMTHELVASMLGVRREGISEVAGKLQRANIISYRRGHITVLNRSGLESKTCECYGVVKKELNRLLFDQLYRQDPSCTV